MLGAWTLLAICLASVGFPETARPQALAAQTTINLHGCYLSTDSYDSSDATKSTNGQYDSTRYKGDKGDIAVGPLGAPDGLVNSLGTSVGSAKLYGHTHTGPGNQTAVLQIGSQGYCGAHADESTVGLGNVDPGWWMPDSNFRFSTTPFPTTTGYQTTIPSGYLMTSSNWSVSYTTNVLTYPDPAPPGGVTIVCGPWESSTNPPSIPLCEVITNNNNGVKSYQYQPISGYSYNFSQTYSQTVTNYYDNILFGGGASSLSGAGTLSNPYIFTPTSTGQTNYFVANSLSGNTVVVGTNVVLAMPNGINMSGNDSFTVGQGANVVVYSGGTSCTLGGNGVFNQAGFPTDFILFGPPTVTTFNFNGNGSFIGCLVAPNANININGSGSNTQDFSGCVIGNSITMNGNFNFHFDENLTSVQLCLPEITAQPQSQNVALGQNVEFSVSADAAATYQWRFNGTNLLDATNATLTLNNVQPGSGGAYSVVVANAFGSVTSIAALLALPPPVITTQPTNLVAVVGGTATFSVAADGQLPLSYQWQVNGVDLPGQTNASLTIPVVQSSDFTNYTVLVSDADGSVLSAVAALTQAASPVISSFGLNLDTATLVFTTERGPTYVVEYKLSLTDASWRELTRVAGTGSPTIVTDNGLTDAAKFYRIHVE